MAQVDRFDNRREHTQTKLALYRNYLAIYLEVLLHNPYVRNINIFDVFAGSGVAQGSVSIAAEAVNNARASSSRNITLKLNDADKKNTESLSEHLKDYRDFISIENVSANEYIEKHLRVSDNANNLFFIDPFGYSQISRDNFDRLFSIPKSDFLIFLPVSSIYRFLRRPDHRDDAYYQPVAKFLKDMGINNNNAENAENFADIIKDAIQKCANAEYVYSHILESKGGPNKYCLYFICRHILGAEKFLEVQKKIEDETTTQLSFLPNDRSISDFLDRGKEYNNVDLYKIGIIHGLLPKLVRNKLEQMEEDGKIEVILPSKGRRRRGDFYIGYNYFKNEDERISIRLKDKHE